MGNSEAMDHLVELAIKLNMAKEREEAVKDIRIALEGQIAELIPTKETGQKTQLLSDGRKITVKRALSYTADILGIKKLFDQLQGAKADTTVYPPIKSSTTESLDVVGYEWFKENNLYVFNKLMEFVSVKPRKPTVTIKEPKV